MTAGCLSSTAATVSKPLKYSLRFAADATAELHLSLSSILLMAVEEVNARGGAGGQIMLQPLIKDDGTVAAGQYDPAQAATNTRQMLTGMFKGLGYTSITVNIAAP